jgi:hypothetical protein
MDFYSNGGDCYSSNSEKEDRLVVGWSGRVELVVIGSVQAATQQIIKVHGERRKDLCQGTSIANPEI